MIKSIINGDKTTDRSQLMGIKIDSEQMVMAALEIMLTHKEFELPVFESGSALGWFILRI